MPALTEFEPLRNETVDTIRARIDANVNAGLDPTDARWQDNVPGGWFYDHTQSFALESEMLWDYTSLELPASFLLPFSWGIYLDYWGELLNVARNPAAAATGVVTLSNTTDADILAAAGTEVAQPAPDVDTDPLTFVTDASATVPGTVTTTGDWTTGSAVVTGIPSTAGMAAGRPVSGAGIPVGATVLSVDGPGQITLSEPTTADGAAAELVVTGTADVPVTADATGVAYNVASGSVTLVTSPVSGLEVTNATAITGGADEELDEPYKQRLLLEFTGTRGGGTPDDYIAETLQQFPTVGSVVVQRAWAGPNTVRLVIADHQQAPLSGAVVTAVQAYWNDAAPIDAIVTVATVTRVDVAVDGTVALDAGYSLDGDAGTTPVRQAITDALHAYFQALPAGADVLHNRVLSVILSVDGVYNVTALTLNGAAGDVTIADLESAQLLDPPTLAAA